MRNDQRKKLLADYAVALVAERELWERLHQSHLTEAERCRALGEWKHVASTLKRLVRQLRDAPAAPVVPAARAVAAREDETIMGVPSTPGETEGATAGGPSAAAPAAEADRFRARFPVPSLVAALRLLALWRSRLGAAIPSLGSP